MRLRSARDAVVAGREKTHMFDGDDFASGLFNGLVNNAKASAWRVVSDGRRCAVLRTYCRAPRAPGSCRRPAAAWLLCFLRAESLRDKVEGLQVAPDARLSGARDAKYECWRLGARAGGQLQVMGGRYGTGR